MLTFRLITPMAAAVVGLAMVLTGHGTQPIAGAVIILAAINSAVDVFRMENNRGD
jgi:hypothetical protein